VHGHVSVEISPTAQRVVGSRFPSAIVVQDVLQVDLEMVKQWSQRFSQVGLVILGAGPLSRG
jgi:hypothetical protein